MDVTDLVFIDSAGYHFADFPTFQAWLISQYQGIYGTDVYLQPDSQDGQFLAIVSQAMYDLASLGASVFNSFAPPTAQGVGLSRLVKINGLTRQVPSNSTVDVVIVGQAGTALVNAIAQDTLQQNWLIPNCVIPGSGTITQTAVAEDPGAVRADANTVTTIFTPTLGWQSVNNPGAATAGAPFETDGQLRARQSQSTANPSLTVLDGTTGGIANLAGVQKVRPYENDTGSTDGNGIPGHSISMVVVGGDDIDICNEIALHKTPGTGTFGNTTERVYDAHGMPLEISFGRAIPATVQCTVTGAQGVGWSPDFIPLIQASVAAAINAGNIGDDVLLSKMFAPAYLLGTAPGLTYTISGITLGKNGGSQSAANVTILYDENPVSIAASDITVNIS